MRVTAPLLLQTFMCTATAGEAAETVAAHGRVRSRAGMVSGGLRMWPR